MDNNYSDSNNNSSDNNQNGNQGQYRGNGYNDATDNGNFYNPNNYSNNNYYSSSNQTNDNGGQTANQNNQTYGQDNQQSNSTYQSADNSNNQNNDPNYSQYGGNVQYKWNYDDYENALNKNKKNQAKKKHSMKPFIITISSIFGVAIIALASVGIVNLVNNSKGNGNKTLQSPTSSSSVAINNQPSSSSSTTANSGDKLTIEQLAEKITPSVVGIEMYDLSSVEPIAEGSGFVVSEDGYIVTNAHVIEDGQKICIIMSDGTKYDTVKLVGKDTKSDLAVLKVNATGLTAAELGNSDELKVGQEVIAIGNPGGMTFANSVTNGIVSGLNRTVSSSTSSSQMTYIQTNALINPGNSGGPLVNMYGQIIGINTSKISQTGYEGLGFAIPSSSAQPIVNDIIQNGYVTGRVKIGITVYQLSNSQAKWYNYPSGLYVESIERDSDAYLSGLRTKDIITEINGVKLANDDASTVYKTFYTEETKYKAGDTVTVKVYRTESDKYVTLSFKLMEDKGDTESETESSSQNKSESQGSNSGNSASDFWSQFGN